MKSTLILAAAVAAIFNTVHTVSAHEPSLSPRAKASIIQSGAGGSSDALDRSILASSPKGKALAESVRKSAKGGSTVDLAHGPLPKFSPRHSR